VKSSRTVRSSSSEVPVSMVTRTSIMCCCLPSGSRRAKVLSLKSSSQTVSGAGRSTGSRWGRVSAAGWAADAGAGSEWPSSRVG
jgi:hypothetical protein